MAPITPLSISISIGKPGHHGRVCCWLQLGAIERLRLSDTRFALLRRVHTSRARAGSYSFAFRNTNGIANTGPAQTIALAWDLEVRNRRLGDW